MRDRDIVALIEGTIYVVRAFERVVRPIFESFLSMAPSTEVF